MKRFEDAIRSAFIAGLDKARECKEAYGEWPSLPGRCDLADDYVNDNPDMLALSGTESAPTPPEPQPEFSDERISGPDAIREAHHAQGAQESQRQADSNAAAEDATWD